MVKVVVKWSNKKFDDVEVDTSEAAVMFKTQLWTLTGVPVERQKLMAKGAWKGVLKDDMSLDGLKDGQQIMLMGSSEALPAPPPEAARPKFIEDMNEEEKAETGTVLPAGLHNMGNTCYMNSTLQCLRSVPELREGLRHYRRTAGAGVPPLDTDANKSLTIGLANMYAQLDLSTDAIQPLEFVGILRSCFPQFAQRGRGGGFSQQDADELYSTVSTALSSQLKEATGLPDLGGAGNLLDALLGMEVEETLSCDETDAEPVVVKPDLTRKLICNISGGGGAALKVDHLHEGIALGMKGSIEKRSEVLGRDALWSKTVRIKRLPRYVCVQYMRFFWKATPDSADHAGVKCKIMRPILYPETFDIFDYCTDDLRATLRTNRDRHGARLDDGMLDAKMPADGEEGKAEGGEAKKMKTETTEGGGGAAAGSGGEAKSGGADADGDVAMSGEAAAADEEGGEDAEALKAAMALSLKEELAPMPSTGPGLPAEFQGNYELFAIVTHKGRSADGGHYVSFVRQDSKQWVVFDDETVSETTTEHVMNLKGGGDEHMAYLAFYRFSK